MITEVKPCLEPALKCLRWVNRVTSMLHPPLPTYLMTDISSDSAGLRGAVRGAFPISGAPSDEFYDPDSATRSYPNRGGLQSASSDRRGSHPRAVAGTAKSPPFRLILLTEQIELVFRELNRADAEAARMCPAASTLFSTYRVCSLEMAAA
jgi:hypothetical protein